MFIYRQHIHRVIFLAYGESNPDNRGSSRYEKALRKIAELFRICSVFDRIVIIDSGESSIPNVEHLVAKLGAIEC